MILGIPKEIHPDELRTSISQEIVKKYISLDYKIIVETNAGAGSYISDDNYITAGAEIVNSSEELYSKADIIIKVNPPTESEINLLKENSTLISFFQIKDQIENLQILINKKITLLSMSHIPRTSLAQKMDALSSQSNIAGYKAVIIGSNRIQKYMPLLMTAAGTIQPAKILILGAGVAGLSAIATAKRLGAQVFAFDVRTIVKEQVESLGAKFIEVESDNDEGSGDGGYAKEVSDEYKKKQSLLLEQEIIKMDLVITTALIPERPAPKLISQTMVESMKPGSVIMDLAAINGGNCDLTQIDKIINHNGVLIDGISNIPSSMSIHATELYAKNVFNFVNHIFNNEEKVLNKEEEITAGATLLNKGLINNELINKFMGKS